jgi:hypothetical protein
MPVEQSKEGGPIATDTKIKILLAEYDALRREIMMRTGHGFQITFIATIGLLWFVTSWLQTANAETWFLLLALVLVVSVASWFTMRDIAKAASRIREIEHSVNSMAGEQLLVWETAWGGDVTGYWGRALPRRRREVSEQGGIMSFWGRFALWVGLAFGLFTTASYFLHLFDQLKSIWPFNLLGSIITSSFAAPLDSPAAPVHPNIGIIEIFLGATLFFAFMMLLVCSAVVLGFTRHAPTKANQDKAWHMLLFLSGFFVGVSTTFLRAM